MRKIPSLIKLRDESGGALAFVAIFLVVLLGFTAMVIDGGRLYTGKGKLQKALDAAVLAGAQGLRTSQAKASEVAIDVSDKNGFKISESDLTYTSNSIKVLKRINVPMTFAKVIGIDNTPISATATAKVGPLTKASGIAPIVIDKSNIPDAKVLNCGETNPGTLQGNCGYLKSDSNLRKAFEDGATYEAGKTAWTDPGGSVGQISDAIQYLIDSDADKPHCQSASTADNQCKRVITVVVIDGWVDVKGKEVKGSSEVKVYGFASYWVEKYEDKKLYGQFIKMIAPGEIGTGTGNGEYYLYGVKLVE
ncbi:TadE/TadG family type IV pilus assembly protein [Neobacillus citreus]|uniref:Tad domain-containing protein n=1 Tax=Neobacillus citreus TaxID=2833578 RepID=A0A942T2R9_9BACI|nr:TadE/TadG family type IV pilus assembly protein [Neobacillus citreus]MCH6267629.1 Tad domain-containing protein [Neobacillus citreus]